MKRTIATIAAGAMLLALGACTVEFPGRSFKAGDFECSKTGSKVVIDKDVGTEIVKHLLRDEADAIISPAAPDPGTLTTLMKECGKFLSGGPAPR